MASEFTILFNPSKLRLREEEDIGDTLYNYIAGGYLVEPEYDGRRCQALLTTNGWIFAGRSPETSGRAEYINISARCPRIMSDLAASRLPTGTLLDGKLFAKDGWRILLRQMTCSQARFEDNRFTEPQLAIFDIIDLGAECVARLPLADRKDLLKGILLPGEGVFACRTYGGDEGFEYALKTLERASPIIEGVALKQRNSIYNGHLHDWFVHKRTEIFLAVVLKVVQGHGKFRGMAGSMTIGQHFPDGRLQRVASIDGMTAAQRQYVWDNQRAIIGSVVSFIAQEKTDHSYRSPRLYKFLDNADPKGCLWEAAT